MDIVEYLLLVYNSVELLKVSKTREFILLIYANEDFTSSVCDLVKLIHQTNMIDIVLNKCDNYLKPNIY